MIPITAPYAALLGICLFGYFVVYPVFEYFRDPKGLRKYPNLSPLAGMTNIPFMMLAHTGARSTHMVELHKKHPVIRIGPNSLSYGDVRAIKDIYGHGTKCTKDGQYLVTSGSHFHLADVIDKPDHARKRKVLSAAYALKNLEEWEHKVADKTERMVKQFDKRCTAPLPAGATVPRAEDLTVDYRKWSNFFSLDAIADIGLSEMLGFLDQGDDLITVRRPDGTSYTCHFRECLYDNARKQSYIVWSYDWYKLIDKATNLIPKYGRMGANGKLWDGIPPELSRRRLERYERGEKLDDFFQALMEDKNGHANNLEWGEIVAEVSIMMNAGSATTAIAMTNVLYQLIKHPEILRKVREEVDAALDEDDVVAPYDKVKHLPYMRACLDEALRLNPPTPQGLPRETPPEGWQILGDWVAGNTSVAMSALVAHRDEKVFPQADRYVPERWLGEAGKALQPYFISFSAGARGCIGRNISYLEQAVVLATMVHRYEFALPSPAWELQREETMNWLLKDMPVKVWRREREAEKA
ncbi:Benzoate 4-monooxygenase cytochrome p450 protein [Neofusicoccum parvum]|uniref:Putative benzoate 4-monooxygenase cytochrome p450 protein n=1 Tax=Botryosphaeria parva (strain UCR-NP2) TaxID=1287680 RepID=R1EDB8_BOTPV|nr:putative benzoate 4-monooxygenase cytochrome p450 protein [Neofusicoccum parvum UCRNP2]GME39194.1 Benzoate 4-monooxygenase cytochrome p450 protein [Neofusicoccum parvum]